MNTFDLCKVGMELRCPVYEVDKGPWFYVKVVEVFQESVKVEIVDSEEDYQRKDIGEQFVLTASVLNQWYRKIEYKTVEVSW